MRILICIATMGPGGAERQVAYLVKGLIDAGAEVHVALLSGGGPNFDRLCASGAQVHVVEVFPRRYRFVGPIVKLLRHVKPDITYLWQRPFDVLGGVACLISGVNCVHAERTDPAKLRGGLKSHLRKRIVALSSGIVANSDAGRRYWELAVKTQKPVRVIPNIIPAEELTSIGPSPETVGAAVVIGRLDAGKNVMLLVQAIAALRDEGITIPLYVVGMGPQYDVLRDYITKHGLGGQVILAGHRADAWALMKGSRLFVSVSRYEGEPNAVLEALAMRCNLLLSDIPPHRSIAGTNATYVDPDSIDEIVSALRLIFKEPVELHAHDDGLESFIQSRSVAAISERHIDFFQGLLSAQR